MKWLHTLLLRGLLIAASLLCAGQAWAVCSYSPRMNLGDIVINPGLVRVARDAAIGAIVGSQTVGIPNTGGLIWIGQCAANGYGGFNIALNVNQGTSVAGQSNVYSTNIQGIGFRIRTLGSNANTWPTGVGVFNAAAASVYIGWRQIQFDLVKTAAIVGNGQLTPGEYGRAQVSGNPFDQYFRVVVAGGGILTPTCSVDAGSQNVTVPLGSVYRTAFQGAGSTTAPSAFSFRLNCNSLPAGQGTRS